MVSSAGATRCVCAADDFFVLVLFSSQVKHGHSKLVWCSLVGKVFSYYRNQEDKVNTARLAAIGCLLSRCFHFEFPTCSCACLWVLVTSWAAADARGPGAGSGPLRRLGRGQRSRRSGLPVVPLHLGGAAQGAESHLPADWHQAGKGAGRCTFFRAKSGRSASLLAPVWVVKGVCHPAQDTWLYHLAVAAGSSGTFKVGTEYEQLIGQLLDAEGDPGEESQPTLLV